MSLRTKANRTAQPAQKLCAIDRAVLEAHRAGTSWKAVSGMHSEATYRRTLARAQWRQTQAG